MTEESLTTSEREFAEVSWGNVTLGGAALLFCLPALFGCTGTFVPQLLYPNGTWPVETWWQRLMTGVYTWSVVLAMLSPPASVVGVALGAWAIRRAGRRTAFGTTLLWILLTTVGLSLAFAVQILWMVKGARPR